MPHERAGLEQVGPSAAAVGDAEAGGAAGRRKTGNRKRREAIVGAYRGAGDAAGRAIRSQRRAAIGDLRAAEAGRPRVGPEGRAAGSRPVHLADGSFRQARTGLRSDSKTQSEPEARFGQIVETRSHVPKKRRTGQAATTRFRPLVFAA